MSSLLQTTSETGGERLRSMGSCEQTCPPNITTELNGVDADSPHAPAVCEQSVANDEQHLANRREKRVKRGKVQRVILFALNALFAHQYRENECPLTIAECAFTFENRAA